MHFGGLLREMKLREIKYGIFEKRLDFTGEYAVYCMSVEAHHTSRGGAGVARRAHNPKVGSSNLPPATTKRETHQSVCLFFLLLCDWNEDF